jgi:hypothetical protein
MFKNIGRTYKTINRREKHHLRNRFKEDRKQNRITNNTALTKQKSEEDIQLPGTHLLQI